MHSNELTGSIEEDIGSLINLEVLQLSYNDFSGTFPDNLGNLTLLEQLYLDNNNFSGDIPSFVNLESLERLYLNDNHFDGIDDGFCDLDFPWGGMYPENCAEYGFDCYPVFNISNNEICSYPSCLEDYMGDQDVINCIEEFSFALT